MKKTVYFVVFAALFLSLIFSGCSGFSEKPSESFDGYIVTGKISLNGAAPSIKFNNILSRTATSSMEDRNFNSDDFVMSVTKIDDDFPYDEYTSWQRIDAYTMSYSLVIKDVGNYLISCSLKDYGLEGSVQIEIIENNFDYFNKEITLFPVGQATDKKGYVDLDIEDESGKIKSVFYKGTVLSKSNSDEESNSFATGNFVNFVSGQANIKLENIHPNSYEITFTFTDAENGKGNTLYECKESVVVLGGFTTDTWYGRSAHMSQKDSGESDFIVTDILIEKFGTELVPDTKYVLYNFDEQEDIYKYYLVDSTDSVNFDTPTINTITSENSFCYDDNGYFYALTKREEDHCKIYSNNPAFVEINNSLIDGDLGGLITVDKKTGFLYAFDSSNSDIYQITQDDGSYSYNETLKRYTPAKMISYSSDENKLYISDSTAFIVNNGIAYFGSAEKDSLTIVDLSTITPGESEGYYDYSGSDYISLGISELEKTESARITDMIYQDGYVYLLLKDFLLNFGADVNNFAMTSRGAIFRYSLFNRTVSGPLGWTDNDNGTVFKYGDQAEENEKFSPVYRGSPIGYTEDSNGYYPDADLSEQLASDFTRGSGYPDLAVHSITVHTPLISKLDSQFCGPQKLIAIKPKKLVIADSGIAFYTDDNYIWKYKNINRIVTVDLDSFMIDTSDTDSPASFTTKTTQCLYLQSSDYEASMTLSGHAKFVYNEGSYYSCSTAYAGITNGDD